LYFRPRKPIWYH